MNRGTVIGFLIVAALLEASGDAIVRIALHKPAPAIRFALFALGAGLLFAYGCVVNAAPWDFGRLLGLYMVFFFTIVQLISWAGLGQTPNKSVLVGGILIIGGGIVIALGEP